MITSPKSGARIRPGILGLFDFQDVVFNNPVAFALTTNPIVKAELALMITLAPNLDPILWPRIYLCTIN